MNLYGIHFIARTDLPLFLDSTGTILNAVVLGPWFGAFTGFISMMIPGLMKNPSFIPLGIANACVGIVAGYIRKFRGFKDYRIPLLAAMILAVTSLLISFPLSVYLYGGYTGGNLDYYQALLVREGFSSLFAAFLARAAAEPVDKLICAYLAWIAVSLGSMGIRGKASHETH